MIKKAEDRWKKKKGNKNIRDRYRCSEKRKRARRDRTATAAYRSDARFRRVALP